jgi:hypothetical protein
MRRISRAAYQLRHAPESLCPHCGRVTKTTSDGVCADCWGGKGGVMGWRHDPPRESFFDDVLDVLGFLLRW